MALLSAMFLKEEARQKGPLNRHVTVQWLQCSCEEVEKEACFILGLLAIKQEYQASIAEAGALPGLVTLLKRYVPFKAPPNPGPSPLRRLHIAKRKYHADALDLTNILLALEMHCNMSCCQSSKTVRGVPPKRIRSNALPYLAPSLLGPYSEAY